MTLNEQLKKHSLTYQKLQELYDTDYSERFGVNRADALLMTINKLQPDSDSINVLWTILDNPTNDYFIHDLKINRSALFKLTNYLVEHSAAKMPSFIQKHLTNGNIPCSNELAYEIYQRMLVNTSNDIDKHYKAVIKIAALFKSPEMRKLNGK